MPGAAGQVGTAYVTILPDFGRLNRELTAEGNRIRSTLHKAAGTLHFKGDTTQLQRSVRGAGRAVEGYSRTAERAHSRVKKRAEESVAANVALTGSFRQMARTAVTAGFGFAAAYVGLSKAKDAIKSTEELAHATEILHRNTGLSVKSSSDWIAIAHSRGVQAGALNMSFTRLSKAFLGADAGQKAAVDSLKLLGLNQKQVHAGATNFDTALRLTADSLGKMKGGTDRLAGAQAVLGRGAKDLVPLFADGAKGLDEQLANAKKYGVELNARTLPLLDKLVQNQRQTKLASLGLKVAFTTAVAPSLLKVERASLKLARIWNDPRLTSDQKWHKIGQTIGGMWKSVEGQFQKAIPKIANSIGHNAPKLASALVSGFIKADAWGKLAIGAFVIKKLGGISAFGKLGADGGKAFGRGFRFAAIATFALLVPELGKQLGHVLQQAVISAAKDKGPIGDIARKNLGADPRKEVIVDQGDRNKQGQPRILSLPPNFQGGLAVGDFQGQAISTHGGTSVQRGQPIGDRPGDRSVKTLKDYRKHATAAQLATDALAASQRRQVRGSTAFAHSTDLMSLADLRATKSIRSLERNSVAAVKNIGDKMGFHTFRGRRAVEDNFRGAVGAVGRQMRKGTLTTDQGMTEIRRLMRIHSKGGAAVVDTNFQTAVKSIKDQMRSGRVSTDRGMSAIAGLMGTESKSGAKRAGRAMSHFTDDVAGAMSSGKISTRRGLNYISSAFDKAASAFGVTKNVSAGLAQATAIVSSFVPKAARGRIMQFGQQGAAGRDTIFADVGGHPVVVGSGEQAMVFTRHQQAEFARRTADVGGPQGFFKTYDKPHYMAQGGPVPGFHPIKRPIVGGPDSNLKPVAQGAIDEDRDLANKRLRKLHDKAVAKAAAQAAAAAAGVGPSSGPSGTSQFMGHPIANWIIPEIKYALKHGWRGQITSGWRDPRQVVHSTIVAPQGHSEHNLTRYPGGAIDVGSPAAKAAGAAFNAAIQGYPGARRLIWGGPVIGDWGHFSGTGHARGGIIGKLLAKGGLLAKRNPPPRHYASLDDPSGLDYYAPSRQSRHLGREMVARMWRAAHRLIPKTKSMPRMIYEDIGFPAYATDPDKSGIRNSGDVYFPPQWLDTLATGRKDVSGYGVDRTDVVKLLVHEWAHAFQDPKAMEATKAESLFPHGPYDSSRTKGPQLHQEWKAEGGAEAFSREHAAQIARAARVPFSGKAEHLHRRGDPYNPFVQRVHRLLGEKWINRTQFGAREGEGAFAKGAAAKKGVDHRLQAAINIAEVFWSHTRGFNRHKPNAIQGRVHYGNTGLDKYGKHFRGETYHRNSTHIWPPYAAGAGWEEFARTVTHEAGHLSGYGHTGNPHSIMYPLKPPYSQWRLSVPWVAKLGEAWAASHSQRGKGPANGGVPYPPGTTPGWFKGGSGGGSGGGGGGTGSGTGGGHWVRGHWAGTKGAKYDKHQNPYGSIWTAGEYAGLAHARGLSKHGAQIAGAVAMVESYPSGKFASIGDGGHSRGPWQIDDVYHHYNHAKALTDPWYTAQLMRSISSNGTNWQPWTTYRDGAYRSHMGAAARLKPYLGKLISKGHRHWVPGHHVNGPGGTGSTVKGRISKLTQQLLKMGINKGRAVKPWTDAIAKLEDRIQQDDDAYPHLTHLAEIGKTENGKDAVTLEVENRKDQLDALLSEQSLAQFALPAFKRQVGPLRKKYDRVVDAVKRNATQIAKLTGVTVNAGTPSNSPKPGPSDYGPDGEVTEAFARKQVLRDFPGAKLKKAERENNAPLQFEDTPHNVWAIDVVPKGAKKSTGETLVDRKTGQVLQYEIGEQFYWGDRKPVQGAGKKKAGEGEGIGGILGALAKGKGGGGHVSQAFADKQARRQFPGASIKARSVESEAPKFHPNQKQKVYAFDMSNGGEVLVSWRTGEVLQWEQGGKIHDGDRFPGKTPTTTGTTTATGGKGGGKKATGKPTALDNLYADQVALTGFKNPKPTDYWFHHAKDGSLLGKVWGELGSRIASRDTLTGILHDLAFVSPAGTIGGKIQDKRDEIESLGGSAAGVTANSALADALRAKLQETNLALDVSERHFKVLRDSADLLPPYGGSFATGGVVPGPAGEARTIIAHGGEVVTPPEHNGGGAEIRVIVEDHRVRVFRDDVEQIVHQVTRQQARSAGRPLPGRSGVLA